MRKIVGSTQIPLTATVTGTGGGITGLTVVVAIRRTSDNYYYDFNDDMFKNAGWGIRQAVCSEVSISNAPGTYERIWDSSLAIASPICLSIEFDVSGSENINVSDSLDLVASTEDDVWDALKSNHTGVNTFGGEVLDSSSVATALNSTSINANTDFNTLGGALNVLRKNLTNRRVLTEGDTANFTLYDDDDVSPIIVQDVQDKNSGVIVADAGAPMGRNKAV